MRVLFVDDDVDDREFFMDALSYVDSSITCILANNCEQALEILKNSDDLPAYIFLDIHMPDMNGKSCLAQIRENAKWSQVKVVMYSTASDPLTMQEYKKLGATYFLIKPPTFKDLCASLSVMFDR